MTEIKGSINVRVGCMFAGKSTYLLQQYRKYSRKYKTLIIKYENDIRYSNDGIGTHDAVIHNDNVIVSSKNINKIYPITKDFQVICIEEGQFYQGLTIFCDRLANEGKRVIVVGLDGNADRNGFGEIPLLLPISETFKKIHAVCEIKECNNDAAFTQLRGGQKLEGKSELVGGAELYQAVCRKHYFA